MTLGIRLHAARLAKGHSLRTASIFSCVSPSTISRAERDLGVFDTQVLYKLAAYCGISLDALVTGSNAELSDTEVDAFLVGLGYNLDELRTEINALIDELRKTAKAILAQKGQATP